MEMNSILQDVRHALRQWRRSPGFPLTAIAVLALGLGANIAVFSVLNGVLLRPLPYFQPDRVVQIDFDQAPMQWESLNYANMLQLRDVAHLQMGADLSGRMISVAGPGGRFQVAQVSVTAGTFSMLGVHPALGREFREEEEVPGKERVIVLSDAAWRKLYNADPQVLGKTLVFRGDAYTIVGVMPPGFSFSFGANAMQIWSPQAFTAANRSAMAGEEQIYGTMYARLPEGMTAAQLAARLSPAQAAIARETPAGEGPPARIKVTPYQQTLVEDIRKPLLLLYGVTIGIWALACLNVASLMLTRAVSHSREQAIRSALGASRGRLVQQSLVESLLLSGVGSLTGLIIAQAAIRLLRHQLETHIFLFNGVHFDWRLICGLAAVTLVTSVIVGVIPARWASSRSVQARLHGANSTATTQQNRTREALVAAQIALTLVFLVGAGLFLRTVYALRHVALGFSQENILSGGVILNPPAWDFRSNHDNEPNIVQTHYMPLLERLRAIPGATDVALSSVVPMRGEFAVKVSGTLDHHKPAEGHERENVSDGRVASADFAETLGIPMVRGRFFTNDDTTASPAVVVVNQAFVNTYLPGQDPIRHVYGMGEKGRFTDAHIVGVIGDVKQGDVKETTRPEVYVSLAQIEPGTPFYSIARAFMEVAIRASVPGDSLRAQFDKALHEVAPDATTTNVETMRETVEDSFGSQTLIAHLLEAFAGLALMIASVGLYGLLSFTVAQRTREIGVRIALGAPQGNILALVMKRALVMVGIGLAAGTGISWFAVRFASSYIYGVKAHDALTFATVAVVLGAASFVAAWLPARRAASVDPILALRSE
jgi:predicted permease